MLSRILYRKNMKKVPLTIFPLLTGIILLILFATVVPKDGDLISAGGDMVLGQIVGLTLVVCLVMDIKKFLKKRRSH